MRRRVFWVLGLEGCCSPLKRWKFWIHKVYHKRAVRLRNELIGVAVCGRILFALIPYGLTENSVSQTRGPFGAMNCPALMRSIG